jgi:hypothetical protein
MRKTEQKPPREKTPRRKAVYIAPLVLIPIVIAFIFLPPWERWFPPTDWEHDYVNDPAIVTTGGENQNTGNENQPPDRQPDDGTQPPDNPPPEPTPQHVIDLENGIVLGKYGSWNTILEFTDDQLIIMNGDKREACSYRIIWGDDDERYYYDDDEYVIYLTHDNPTGELVGFGATNISFDQEVTKAAISAYGDGSAISMYSCIFTPYEEPVPSSYDSPYEGRWHGMLPGAYIEFFTKDDVDWVTISLTGVAENIKGPYTISDGSMSINNTDGANDPGTTVNFAVTIEGHKLMLNNTPYER